MSVPGDTPWVNIKKDGTLVRSETVKSVDDLKIFLEERLYQSSGSLMTSDQPLIITHVLVWQLDEHYLASFQSVRFGEQ